MGSRRDVVVVGGGHNGLVAAAYLARDGLDVLVCERREVVGGAAVSERPFGPDYLVTSLSYVVSLLPADLVSDLQLAGHGYHVFPQGPYFAPRADGSYLRLPDDPAARHKEFVKFSAADAAAYPAYEARMREIGQVLGPMLKEIPARLGSRRPARPGPAGDAAAAPAQAGRTRDGGRHPAAHRQHRRPAGCLLRVGRGARAAVGVRGDRRLGRAEVGGHRLPDAAPPRRRHRWPRRSVGVPAWRDGRGHRRPGRRGPLVRRGDPHRRRGGQDPGHARRPGGRRDPGFR